MSALTDRSAVLSLAGSRQRRRELGGMVIACVALLAIVIIGLGSGAASLSPARILDVLAGQGTATDPLFQRDTAILFNIRIPRVLIGCLVGAALAVSGALLQGLFRNPLADPGLVGVSAGAALAAAATIVLGDRIVAMLGMSGKLAFELLPVAAFGGGLATTLLLYLIATREGRTSVGIMLLTGIALGALAFAITGMLAFISNDQQLRDLSFWSLGSLGGATWAKARVIAPVILPLLLAIPFLARGLNALSLGEAEAFYLGIRVQRLKAICIGAVALAVGASVSVSGVIGFVGIIVPHVIRLTVGADHRMLLPLSAILGAALIVAADTLARTAAAPAELPVGVVTAVLGAPFFLWLLLRRGGSLGL